MEGNILVSGAGSGWLQYSGRPHLQDWAAAHGNPIQQHASRYTAPRGRCGELPMRFSLGAGWSDEPDNQFLGVRGSNVREEGVEGAVGRLGRVAHCKFGLHSTIVEPFNESDMLLKEFDSSSRTTNLHLRRHPRVRQCDLAHGLYHRLHRRLMDHCRRHSNSNALLRSFRSTR